MCEITYYNVIGFIPLALVSCKLGYRKLFVNRWLSFEGFLLACQ